MTKNNKVITPSPAVSVLKTASSTKACPPEIILLNETGILFAIIMLGTISIKILQRRRFNESTMVENIRFERSRSDGTLIGTTWKTAKKIAH